MKRTDKMDSGPARAAEDSYEIIDSLFDSCDNWQCKKCGMRSLGSRYHRCDANITKTVCEYCRFYLDETCKLQR